MTLEARDKLISDMIKENPDATIKDYVSLLKDIESIEVQASKEPTRLKMFQRRDGEGRFAGVSWLPSY